MDVSMVTHQKNEYTCRACSLYISKTIHRVFVTYYQKCSMCKELLSKPHGPQCDINNEKYMENDFHWNMNLHRSKKAQ